MKHFEARNFELNIFDEISEDVLLSNMQKYQKLFADITLQNLFQVPPFRLLD